MDRIWLPFVFNGLVVGVNRLAIFRGWGRVPAWSLRLPGPVPVQIVDYIAVAVGRARSMRREMRMAGWQVRVIMRQVIRVGSGPEPLGQYQRQRAK